MKTSLLLLLAVAGLIHAADEAPLLAIPGNQQQNFFCIEDLLQSQRDTVCHRTTGRFQHVMMARLVIKPADMATRLQRGSRLVQPQMTIFADTQYA